MLLIAPAVASAGASAGQAAADIGPQSGQVVPYVRLLLGLSLLSFVPAALVAMTSFTRIVVTLSFLRHALGMPETPPNSVLMTLALFLTFFTMAPTLEKSYQEGLAPFLDGKAAMPQSIDKSVAPLKTFMTEHVRPEDLQSVMEIARLQALPEQASPPMQALVPAFMLSELRAAFAAGFIIFLPFLLIDLVVVAVLMALGMMMVPPSSISMPLKLLLFVLIDGWALLLRSLAGVYA
eukprot:gene50265-61499_t